MKHVNIIKVEHVNTHIYLHADYMKISDVINTQDVITTSPRCHQHLMSESEIQESTLHVF